MIAKILTVSALCAFALANGQIYEENNFVYDVPHSLLRHYRSYEPQESIHLPETQFIQQIENIPFEYNRVRRQTLFGGVTPGNPGQTVTLGTQGNLFNQNGHSLDGRAQVSKTFNPTGVTSLGGGLDYQGPRGGASLNANHARHFGTDVGITGNANLWRSPDRRSSLDANANYNRHFGGPFGTGRPNYGVGATFRHNF